MKLRNIFILYLIIPQCSFSQDHGISDNSFLIEEAYNQEAGVVQHISLFDFSTSNSIGYNFTQEWPLSGQKHQFSYTVPVFFNGKSLHFDNLFFNYRYQLISIEKVVVAPRFSFSRLSGNGRFSKQKMIFNGNFQTNIPVSIAFSDYFVFHLNYGLTYRLSRNRENYVYKMTSSIAGCSVVWLFHSNLNFLTEFIYSKTGHKAEQRDRYFFTLNENEWIINPGFRGAIDFDSGLQIVTGLALPILIYDNDKTTINSVLFYLSFEHRF